MRGSVLLLTLIAAASTAAIGQTKASGVSHFPNAVPFTSAVCRGADLSVRHVTEDAAMGGHNTIDYAFKNDSTSPCTLMGYPRFELLDKSGRVRPRGRAINSQQLPGDEAKQPPQLVRIGPGNEAWFRVYYNSGGAGYVGKPCPVARMVWISAPGTTRSFVLPEQITSCRSVRVSAVRSPLPE
jgi:hypothetical protein